MTTLRARIERKVTELRDERRMVAHSFRVIARSQISRMAAALAYRTVFGLIPVLVIGVAVLGGFASDQQVTDTVERVLALTGLDQVVVNGQDETPGGTPGENRPGQDAQGAGPLAGGAETELDAWLKSLVEKVRGVSFVAIGLTGLIVLAYAAISFMVEIERAANHIYRAPTGRSWVRRVTQYWTTLTLGSIFLVGTFYVSDRLTAGITSLTGSADASFGAQAAGLGVSLLIDFVLLFFVYMTVPNARVMMRCAAIGAAIAAVAWEVGKWAFTFIVTNSAAQTFYGAIALVPLFLLWVYITWIIVLSGLQISYVLQHFRTFAVAEASQRGPSLVEPLTLVRVAMLVAQRFVRGETATLAEVASGVGLDDKTALVMLEHLTDEGVLNRVPFGDEREGFSLARPAEQVRVRGLLEIASRLTGRGSQDGEPARVASIRRAQLDATGDFSLAQMLEEAGPAEDRPDSEQSAVAPVAPAPDLRYR